MAGRHHVYLVPGFFGFANLSDLKYFGHVRGALEPRFEAAGVEAVVHDVITHPTASIRLRARRLLETIAATADGTGPVHLVGHSTGGLDARLLVAAGTSLSDDLDLPVEAWAARVRTVLTVATPHRGTPSAALFSTLFGRQLLKLLSLWTIRVVRTGSVPGSVLAGVARLVNRVDGGLGGGNDLLDELVDQLLHDFSPERREVVERFFREVSEDQSLLLQLTPDSMDLFHASVPDRPGVRYGAIVTRGRRPGIVSAFGAGMSPAAQTSHALYVALHQFAGSSNPAAFPPLTPGQAGALASGFVDPTTERSNDGMVPTLSQPWGEVVVAAWADHLDIIGHFDDPGHDPPHYDWLISGTGFRRDDFEGVWGRAFEFLLGP